MLGFAGLADNFVEWHEFFTIHFFDYYLTFRELILSAFPFRIPGWVFDYYLLGGIFGRALLVSLQFDSKEIGPIWSLFIFLLMSTIWPWSFLLLFIDLKQSRWNDKEVLSVFANFGKFLVLMIVGLFIFVDFHQTFLH